MKPKDYTKLYKAVPLFSSLSHDELDEVIGISKMFKAPNDFLLLEEGKPGHGLYVIVKGMATCRLKLFQGDDTHLANLYEGDVIGEMSLIDDGPVSATVVTVNECVLLHIEKSSFDELRSAMRPAAYKILRNLGPTLCERLRAINTRMGEVFNEPEKHLRLMERRYQNLSKHASTDAPGGQSEP
jgi:CRP/FNR family cyclic AMP-dependent transcriptional regulator